MSSLAQNLIIKIGQIGADPGDDDVVRLQKSLLAICALPFAFAGFAWGVMYTYFDQPLAAAIPFSYGVISLLSMALFGVTRRYHFFRFSQLTLIILLPFSLMQALGGFVTGSAVVMWGFICPIAAMLFDNQRNSVRWYAAFLGSVILSGFLEPFNSVTDALPPDVIIFFFVVNIMGSGALIFILVFYFVGQKNMYEERSETLLLNILPKEIVNILKTEQRTIADRYETSSILFCDIVGSTPLFAEMEPEDVVDWLNEVFSMFDQLVEKYGVEKIRTIGDNYMVAAGVPTPQADHAKVIADFALDMVEGVKHIPDRDGKHIEVRVGINSGPIVAGVIGTSKFQYDLWGDAVNVASRMESHADTGAIQISNATYDLIKDAFECEYRGKVPIKGKEWLETWYLRGRKSA